MSKNSEGRRQERRTEIEQRGRLVAPKSSKQKTDVTHVRIEKHKAAGGFDELRKMRSRKR